MTALRQLKVNTTIIFARVLFSSSTDKYSIGNYGKEVRSHTQFYRNTDESVIVFFFFFVNDHGFKKMNWFYAVVLLIFSFYVFARK